MVCKSDIAKLGTGNQTKTKMQEYINKRGPRPLEKPTEAKIARHVIEFTLHLKGKQENEESQAR